MAKKTLGYVEMEWTCPRCGTRNPGPEQSCVNCGAPQPDDVQFEQAQREELLTDQSVEEKAAAGADIHCPYCGTRNPAGAQVCVQCGGDLVEGLKRERGRVVGAYRSGPVGKVNCPRCGAENPDTARECEQCGASLHAEVEQAAVVAAPPEKPAARKRSPLFTGIVIAVAAIACIAILIGILLSMRTEAVIGRVQEVEWQRVVVVEGLRPVEYQDWMDEIPLEAEIGECEQEIRSIQNDPVANSVEVCGTPYTVDTGTGYGEVVQDCEYQVYDDYCTYTLIEWQPVDEVVLNGKDYQPEWPEPVLGQDERLSQDRDESYTIVYDSGEQIYVFTTNDFDLFMASQVGSEWSLNVNSFGTVVSVER